MLHARRRVHSIMTKTAGRVCICDAVASLSFSKARSPGKGERFWGTRYSVLFPSPESADCGEVPGLANPLEIDIDISQPEGVYPGLFLGQSFNVHLRHFPQPVPSKVIWWNSCAPFLTRVLTSTTANVAIFIHPPVLHSRNGKQIQADRQTWHFAEEPWGQVCTRARKPRFVVLGAAPATRARRTA